MNLDIQLLGEVAPVSSSNHFCLPRYYLNDLTYRTDPPKSSTESYNVRRRKSKWSVKEPEKEAAKEASKEAVKEAETEPEFSIADLGY